MTEQSLYNDKELLLLKDTFADNESLLKSMRKLLFGAEITKAEKDTIKKTFANKELLEAVRHKAYGTNKLDTRIGQLSDFWMGIEQKISGQNPVTIEQHIKTHQKVFEMLIKAFELLENPDGDKVSTEVVIDFENDPLMTSLIARNLYKSAIEQTLYTIKTIAGTKSETLEETLKRVAKDSSK